MITALEPLEFIPRGRQAVEEHPGPLVSNQKHSGQSSENVLLHRLQNVNIAFDDYTEFWSIHEKITSLTHASQQLNCPGFYFNFSIHTEDELYVKGNTAVWHRGSQSNTMTESYGTCYSCETPIKYAFFCSTKLVSSKLPADEEKVVGDEFKLDSNNVCICLIDAEVLKVYCADGEHYTTALDFPVSSVWPTKYGIIFEKEAHAGDGANLSSIHYPCIFSLSHPLEEIRPVLLKTITAPMNYFNESDYKLIFTAWSEEIALFYDYKNGSHFICILRKATDTEIDMVNETLTSAVNISTAPPSLFHSGVHNTPGRFGSKNSSSKIGKSSFMNTPHTPTPQSSFNRTSGSHLALLQSTLGMHQTAQNMRKIDTTAPSKPIIPDLCFETIWTESTSKKNYTENASHGFFHQDFIGQTYICYMLVRKCELILLPVNKVESQYVFGETRIISAKDAVSLKSMNMIVLLRTCGTLMLYSGTTVIGKVHIGGMLSSLVTSSSLTNLFVGGGLPRRSSLLPTGSTSIETNFEEEFHTLSPVHPLQHQYKTASFGGLRDPAGNRLTISYPGGKLYRFSLPNISGNILITKCLITLRNVLDKALALNIIAKWYGVRNAPGTYDYSPIKEWTIFSDFLLDLMGQSLSCRDTQPKEASASPNEEPKKRRKTNSDGSDSDWEFLLMYTSGRSVATNNSNQVMRIDTKAVLFQYMAIILFSFHLMYEDIKLELSMKLYLEPLAEFLYRMSILLSAENYSLHYFLDYPSFSKITSITSLDEETVKTVTQLAMLTSSTPKFFKYIYQMLSGSTVEKYPIISDVNERSYEIIQLFTVMFEPTQKPTNFIRFMFNREVHTGSSSKKEAPKETKKNYNELVIECFLKLKITRNYIKSFPIALYAIISNVLDQIKLDAPIGHPPEAYELLLRPELVAHASILTKTDAATNDDLHNALQKEHSLSPRLSIIPDELLKSDTTVDEDGMDHLDTKLLRLRFPTDLRINDVRNFLNSSTPVIIDMVQAPNVTDHEFIEEQEKALYATTIRTMALPVGRGMFNLRTSTPAVTECLAIPKLCISGKDAAKGATIEIQQIEVPANMNMWPSFHNGVAAGLKITPDSKDIDSTWIVYNKPKGATDNSTEHAGFLMALGLNGHLKTLSFMNIYEYLVKCDEMTSLGLLLGISTAHRGTQDLTTTKLLSIHIEALLPPTALELDILQNIQIASIMGIGLLYQGSAKRHIAEVLLQEIGRPPGPEMENSVERESYALTTGLALGLVTLGLGESAPGLRDLELTDTLHYYMVGGNQRPLIGAQKDKYKLSSFQIREGNAVNIDVTAPGAMLALGLMYFNTKNEAVANWMKPPETKYLLDFVRPDFLLLRMIAKGLIMWDDIEPTSEWIISQFPKSLLVNTNINSMDSSSDDSNNNIDHEAHCQAYCNVITGAALCVGLRYAGTDNEEAYQGLESIIQMFLSANNQYLGKCAGNATIETCLVTVLLALSLVFAGSGNLNIIRIVRMLRSRIGPSNHALTYGSHMAIHMALGFLFLGAGRFTISRSPESIAALICALFPKFPTHSNDNRYHLQAFRHLYVLAVEPRLLLPRDIDTGKLSLCKVSYVEMGSNKLISYRNAPCILPELRTIKAIYIDDPYFWKISFERGRNWDQLMEILEKSKCVDLKQKIGSFSTKKDPKKPKQCFSQTIKANQLHHWKVDINNLLSFSNDSVVMHLIRNFFIELPVSLIDNPHPPRSNDLEIANQQKLCLIANNCLVNDKMHEFAIGLGLIMIWNSLQDAPTTNDIWQIKLLSKSLERLKQIYPHGECNNFWNEIIRSHLIRFENLLEQWSTDHRNLVKHYISINSCAQYLQNEKLENLVKLAAIVTFYDFPMRFFDFESNNATSNRNYLQLLGQLKHLNIDSFALKWLWTIINRGE